MKNDILNELSLFKVDSHFGRTCEIKKEVKFKRKILINECMNLPSNYKLPILLKEAFKDYFEMNPYLERKAWKSIPHSERMKKLFWSEIYQIDNFKLGFNKPGKEYFNQSNQNYFDMQPYIIRNNDKFKIDESFGDMWRGLARINTNNIEEKLTVLGSIIFRMAWMCDHVVKNNSVRLELPRKSLEFLSDFEISGVPVEVYLKYLDLIATNEDVKYYNRDIKNILEEEKLIKAKKSFFGRAKGRRNTLLTFCHVISVIFDLKNPTKFTTHWAEFAGRMGDGTYAISEKNALEVFPYLKGY